uniref:Uncharacterized protein n=1 Tax=Solanum lycopersicum TaxID=4081 RepID=A0A3Q7IIT5_SOLLC
MCPPFFECPTHFNGLLADQELSRCSRRLLSRRSACYPNFSVSWGPPIAIAISYSTSNRNHKGPPREAKVGLAVSPIELY